MSFSDPTTSRALFVSIRARLWRANQKAMSAARQCFPLIAGLWVPVNVDVERGGLRHIKASPSWLHTRTRPTTPPRPSALPNYALASALARVPHESSPSRATALQRSHAAASWPVAAVSCPMAGAHARSWPFAEAPALQRKECGPCEAVECKQRHHHSTEGSGVLHPQKARCVHGDIGS